MYQIILTPEALKHTGLPALQKIMMQEVNKGMNEGINNFSIIAVEGITNVQLGNLLKPLWKTKATLIIMNAVTKEDLPELMDGSDTEIRLIDREYPQN